ncbi:MAG: hypothetical protein ABIV51_02305 [Saprospiraceae bacterium]
MKLLVEPENTLLEIETQFSQLFPNMKLEFVQTLQNSENTFPAMQLQELLDLRISELAMGEEMIAILIEPKMSATKVKQAFANHYHFDIRISIRSDDQFVEVSNVEDLSLNELNNPSS